MKFILYFVLVVFSLSAKAQIASNSKISNLRIPINNQTIFYGATDDKNSIYQLHNNKNKSNQNKDLLFKNPAENKMEQSNLLPLADSLSSTKNKKVLISGVIKRDLLLRDTDEKPKMIFPKH